MNKNKGILITGIEPESIAEDLEISRGDILLSINGIKPKDILEYWYWEKTEIVNLLIQKKSSELVEYEIEKEIYEPLGLQFDNVLFDGIRQCKQNCLFCFVKQMPRNMRKTLYYRDDYYRLSFLNGNFITGSNLSAEDLSRIAENHFSPLYFSLQAITPKIREFLLGDKNPARIEKQFEFFAQNDIQLHLQIVLCPQINDGEELKKTLNFAFSYHNILSVGLVPVGITRFLPEESQKHIRRFNSSEMEEIFKIAESYKDYPLYLSDEFFLMTGRMVPENEYYDEYPQLENGIGMVRLFLDDWKKVKNRLEKQKKYLLITGELFGNFLKKVLPAENFEILIVKNKFLFSSLLIRHIGAAAAWTILPIMLMEYYKQQQLVSGALTLIPLTGFFHFYFEMVRVIMER
jgi:putative radical SAM enzyme (TIGR03279 family)